MAGFYFIQENFTIISYKKIIAIFFSSSVLGFLVNFYNPNGIPLIREKQELEWAPDSLFIESVPGVTQIEVDSAKINSSIKEINNDSIQQSENNIDIKEKNQIKEEPESENLKKSEKKSGVTAFEEPRAIKLEQAFSLFKRGILFIDARDVPDYDEGHISKSINIPFDDFDNHKQKLENISKEQPLVIYCAGTECDLSHLLANLLFEKGYNQVYVFFGGWVEWFDANYPIEKTQETKASHE